MRAGGRMASACPHWPCPCDRLLKSEQIGKEASCEQEVFTDAGFLATNMDIALLKDQYNSIRNKQKHETRVIHFATAASTNEEISGKSLVDLVSIRQGRSALVRQASVQETEYDFVKDPDNATWHTHLGLYRRTFPIQRYKHMTSNGDSTSTSTDNTVNSLEVTDSTDQLSEDCEGHDFKHHFCNKVQEDCAADGFRKFSAPAVLSRQLSSGSSQSSHTLMSSYYPFPQLKCPKKSEAARRLGLYSSF